MGDRNVRRLGLMLSLIALSGCDLPLPNVQDTVEPMDPSRRLIGEVQGEGEASPLLGSEVLVEGVVVRSLMGDSDDIGQEVKETLGEAGAGSATIGWFIQDEGDGNPATSDGLFVLDRGYDTSINLPAEAQYTMRMGSRVRTGDRVSVRGQVVELEQDVIADQPRTTGHAVSRGAQAGRVTAVAATSVTLVAPSERAQPITVAPVGSAETESSEAMRR